MFLERKYQQERSGCPRACFAWWSNRAARMQASDRIIGRSEIWLLEANKITGSEIANPYKYLIIVN